MSLSFDLSEYHITETLFSNERTAVKRAVRASDGYSVILKQLVAHQPPPAQLSRFSFSYEVLTKFQHPNIVHPIAWISEKDEIEKTGLSGLPLMVMEDNHTTDLFQFLKTQPDAVLPLETFLTIAVQLAEGLSIVHHQQVIHKDLHPGNLLYNPKTGLAQITDFGLASLLSREQPALSSPEHLEGVLAYISPEQTGRMNRALDYRSDFYTLGCTFYHLLSGHPPFAANDALGLVHAHIAKQHTPLHELRSDIPPVLSAIIDKLLMKTAEDRYQSALGLQKDLQKVRRALGYNQIVPDFPLGLDDISDRLQIPQKLYGREKEVERLQQGFFQAAGGKPRMLAVAGYSGIGKSALVHEVHKPIAAYNGFFCAGKFDQFQKNIPYSALQTALKSWIQHALSQPETPRQQLREHLCQSLGANARVLVDFMPDFAWVLGDLPPVAQLGADETQNRFHLVFQRFIKEITGDHPLVLFIDDIQWADRGTLNLLPMLMSEERCRLLLIVAYRDNEVDEHHPAMQTLHQIEQSPLAGPALDRLQLGPLHRTQVATLVKDTLHRPEAELHPLVTLVHAKTAGNPFFINEFLKTLYTEQLLNFHLQQQRWVWDITDIEAKGITDNVVDLMLGKMALLPSDTQELIQLAACVGSRFNLEMLAHIAEQPLNRVTQQLWPALRDGLLLQDGGDWHLGHVQAPQSPQSSQGPVLSQFSPVSPHCRFLHDRMLQAAYQSMSQSLREKTHLRVGRLMMQQRSVGELTDEECFSITEQFNNARRLIDQPEQLEQLMQLNLRAAKQAKAASVWEAATDYADWGVDLLPEGAWQTHYEASKDLYLIKAECAYLSGHPEAADVDYEVIFEHINDDLLRAEICATRLVQCIGRGQWVEGLEHGKRGLGYLGMDVPLSNELEEESLVEKKKLGMLADGELISDVFSLPEMVDPRLLIAMKVLPNIWVCGYIIGMQNLIKYCVYKGCNLILDSGRSDLAAILLTCYAYTLKHQGKYREALQQGIQAKLLADSYPHCREIANCYNLLGVAIWHLHAPFRECVDLNKQGVEYGLENGELARASINFCNTLFSEISQGEFLSQIHQDALSAENFLQKKSVFHPLASMTIKFSEALMSVSEDAERVLDDKSFPLEVLSKIKGSGHSTYLMHYRSQVAFWCGNYQLAYDWAVETNNLENIWPLHSFVMDHYLMFGLAALKRSADLNYSDVEKCIASLSVFADIYPPNFRHKWLLLQAEYHRQKGAALEDIGRLYREAISEAEENGFLQFQALGNELFGSLMYEKGFDDIAGFYLQKALVLFEAWGCRNRVRYIKRHYSDLIESGHIDVIGEIARSKQISDSSGQVLDIASVMKSAQLISKELELSRLSTKVLEVIMESAGASSATLVINLHDVPHVVARLQEETISIASSPERLDDSKDLPINILRYVLNSDQVVNIADVQHQQQFVRDPYLLKFEPRSVLCVPVDYRDITFGALYLENSLTTGAFTHDRLDVIRLLLAQAAISFDNAQLFQEVSELNQTLEKKVSERTDALNRAINDLEKANEELDAFSHSVSHDLRAPLRSIVGFGEMLEEAHADSLSPEVEDLVHRILRNGHKMQDLIEGLLTLSRIQKQGVVKEEVDLSGMVVELFSEMRQRYPHLKVKTHYARNCMAHGDRRMLYSALENLINNAWKYSSKAIDPKVEFGVISGADLNLHNGVGTHPEELPDDSNIYFIKDNGAGFDMDNAQNLFGSFQRLHSDQEFSGTGVGLATVKRVFEKHGGYIWAFAERGRGAVFYFMLPNIPVQVPQRSHLA